jgi:hypothetical protein
MNLKIPLNAGNLTNGGPVSFSGRPLVYGVSWFVRYTTAFLTAEQTKCQLRCWNFKETRWEMYA